MKISKLVELKKINSLEVMQEKTLISYHRRITKVGSHLCMHKLLAYDCIVTSRLIITVLLLVNLYIPNCFMWVVAVRTTKTISPSIAISEGGRALLNLQGNKNPRYTSFSATIKISEGKLLIDLDYRKVFNCPFRSRISKRTQVNTSIRRIRGKHMRRTT